MNDFVKNFKDIRKRFFNGVLTEEDLKHVDLVACRKVVFYKTFHGNKLINFNVDGFGTVFNSGNTYEHPCLCTRSKKILRANITGYYDLLVIKKDSEYYKKYIEEPAFFKYNPSRRKPYAVISCRETIINF